MPRYEGPTSLVDLSSGAVNDVHRWIPFCESVDRGAIAVRCVYAEELSRRGTPRTSLQIWRVVRYDARWHACECPRQRRVAFR